MKPREPRKPGDGYAAPKLARREAASAAGGAGALLLTLIIGGPLVIVAIILAFVGMDLLAGWVVRAMWPLIENPVFQALIGIAISVLSGWALFRVITRPVPENVTRRSRIVAVVTLVGIAALGLLFVAGAAASKPGPTRF